MSFVVLCCVALCSPSCANALDTFSASIIRADVNVNKDDFKMQLISNINNKVHIQ